MENFTVIIPTRNRADTLQSCLRSCLAQDYERLTVLVSDNCSTDNTRDVVESFTDKRLRYTRTANPTSLAENFEHAIATVLGCGETSYVTAIGDDDGLLADGLTYANDVLRDHTGIEALTWQVSTYCWPSCAHPEWRNNLQLAVGDGVKVLNARTMMTKALAYRAYFHHLPGPLTSLVSSDALRRCHEKLGRITISVAHDVGMAVHLGCVMPEYVHVQRSVTLAGSSGHSVGMNLSHLDDDTVRDFLASVPIAPHPGMAFAPNGVYYMTDAFLRARDAGLLPDDLHIDIPLALRLMLCRNPSNPEQVYQHIVKSVSVAAAMHDIEPDIEGWKAQNEAEGAAGALFRDAALFEGERWFSLKCDPRFVNNIFDAVGLARHITLALNGRALIDPETFRMRINEAKAKLSKARDRARKLEKRLAEAQDKRKVGILAKLRRRLRALRRRP